MEEGRPTLDRHGEDGVMFDNPHVEVKREICSQNEESNWPLRKDDSIPLYVDKTENDSNDFCMKNGIVEFEVDQQAEVYGDLNRQKTDAQITFPQDRFNDNTHPSNFVVTIKKENIQFEVDQPAQPKCHNSDLIASDTKDRITFSPDSVSQSLKDEPNVSVGSSYMMPSFNIQDSVRDSDGLSITGLFQVNSFPRSSSPVESCGDFISSVRRGTISLPKDIRDSYSGDERPTSSVMSLTDPDSSNILEDSEGENFRKCHRGFKIDPEQEQPPPYKELKLLKYDNEHYICEVCAKEFSSLSEFEGHVKRHRLEKPYGCQFCPERFSRFAKARSHEKGHTDLIPFYEIGRTSSDLKMKQILHAGGRSCEGLTDSQCVRKVNKKKKTFSCRFCPAQFSHPMQLRAHGRVHAASKPYLCEVCSKQYKQLHTLKNHQRLHLGRKPYVCDVCSRRFAQSFRLKNHKAFRCGIKRYKRYK